MIKFQKYFKTNVKVLKWILVFKVYGFVNNFSYKDQAREKCGSWAIVDYNYIIKQINLFF